MNSAGTSLPSRASRRTCVALALTLVAVELVYVFVISAGTFTHWPTYSNYYDLLAEGFRSGHLDLPIKPYPELVAKSNPWDPVNGQLWLWDASLHHGKYYLYWGPFPALLQLVFKGALHISRLVGDQYLMFGFTSLYALSGALILERIARRLFPAVPLALLVLAVLVLALANPIPHGLASADIYHAAILGGQAFLLLGILFAFDAVWNADRKRSSSMRLVMSGIAWGLALACRTSLAPAVALLAAATVIALHRAPGRNRRALYDCLLVGLPVAAACGALLFYNEMRFDSWFDFGVDRQLSTLRLRESLSCLPRNLFAYTLKPFEWSRAFPFALQVADLEAPGVSKQVWLEAGFTRPEPLVGCLLAVPWCWLVPVGIAGWLAREQRRRGAVVAIAADARTRARRFCFQCFVIAAGVTALPLLVLFVATMRYATDFTPGFVLLATMLAWSLYSDIATSSMARRWLSAGTAVLGIATIVLGLLFGVQGYAGHFQKNNPALYERAVAALSIGNPR